MPTSWGLCAEGLAYSNYKRSDIFSVQTYSIQQHLPTIDNHAPHILSEDVWEYHVVSTCLSNPFSWCWLQVQRSSDWNVNTRNQLTHSVNGLCHFGSIKMSRLWSLWTTPMSRSDLSVPLEVGMRGWLKGQMGLAAMILRPVQALQALDFSFVVPKTQGMCKNLQQVSHGCTSSFRHTCNMNSFGSALNDSDGSSNQEHLGVKLWKHINMGCDGVSALLKCSACHKLHSCDWTPTGYTAISKILSLLWNNRTGEEIGMFCDRPTFMASWGWASVLVPGPKYLRKKSRIRLGCGLKGRTD